MKIFLDANVLVSVLNKEYPLFRYSSRILSLVDVTKFKVFTSPICLAIAFYFAEKKHGNISARKRIHVLAEHLQIATTSAQSVKKTTNNKKIHDFEDGLQYYSALESGCTVIITEDINDFYFSSIEVQTCKGFLEKYI